MSEHTVTKMWSQDGFRVSLDTRTAQKRTNIVESYQITAPATYTKQQISVLPEVPLVGSAYPGLNDTWLVERDFIRRGPIYWEARVFYQGTFPSIDLMPIRKWSKSTTSEPIDEDLNGFPIVTVNGEPIDGLTKDVSDPVLTIQKNFRSINIAAIHQYFDSVNSDSFAGFAPGTGRMIEFSADENVDGNQTTFWAVSASFQFRYPYRTVPARAWWSRVRHEGYYRRVSGRYIKCIDDDGEEVTRPALLNLDGTQRTGTNVADWLEWQLYRPLPYNSLGLLT